MHSPKASQLLPIFSLPPKSVTPAGRMPGIAHTTGGNSLALSSLPLKVVGGLARRHSWGMSSGYLIASTSETHPKLYLALGCAPPRLQSCQSAARLDA